ncbi:MAG: hypothetical protein QCI38_08255 [Candidatus Thermoplasmatota archaeon]|nr:hypothetical protein [Candidatus Thermoplasmatota archaeon]
MTSSNELSIEKIETHMIGQCAVSVLPIVKGLKSNEFLVRDAIYRIQPEALCLPVAQDGIDDMKTWDGEMQDLPLSNEDLVYIHGLKDFGEVSLPPPGYLAALDEAKQKDIPIVALDMDEDSFSKLFCDKVSVFELWSRGRLPRKLLKRKIVADSPEEYAMTWEALLRRNKGSANVEEEREKHIYKALVQAAMGRKRILAIVEYERKEGILRHLPALEP